MNFYSDKNLTKQWNTSPSSRTFNITKNGSPGVSTDAKVSFQVTNDIPEILYYCLKPVLESTLPLVKREIVVDNDVLSGNEIQLTNSDYSGKGIDQLNNIIEQLKNPDTRNSRRLVMSAWNPCQLNEMALPPCHVLCQFNVTDNNKLSCNNIMVKFSENYAMLSGNLVYSNLLTKLYADQMEIDLISRKTKTTMKDYKDKVTIIYKNYGTN